MFKKFLKATQPSLFSFLSKRYKNFPHVIRQGEYIYIQGQAPVLLVAHLDTVHSTPVKTICQSEDGNILMSPEGIGGDDRCGVYALTRIHESSLVKPSLLFTCDEEVGGLGAEYFTDDYFDGKFDVDAKFIVEIDRRGKNDAVYYDCNNKGFEKYVNSKGFITAEGSFSDISVIAPCLDVAAVNLSSGYYNAHTLHEYIVVSELENVIENVIDMVADSIRPEFLKFSYVKRKRKNYNILYNHEDNKSYWNSKYNEYDWGY